MSNAAESAGGNAGRGAALLAWGVRDLSSSVRLYAAAILMGGGALLWCWHVWLRAVDPPMWTARAIPLWLFGGYSVLTIAGLALIGTALLRSRIDAWVGRLAIGAAALFLVLVILFRDMPPFVYYLVTLTIGLKLLRSSTDVIEPSHRHRTTAILPRQ